MNTSNLITVAVWATVVLVAYEAYKAVVSSSTAAGYNANALTPSQQALVNANAVAAGIPSLGIVPLSQLSSGLDFLNQDGLAGGAVGTAFGDIFG